MFQITVPKVILRVYVIFILYTNTQSKFSDNIIRIISCG
jgi:hypothetical protein